MVMGMYLMRHFSSRLLGGCMSPDITHVHGHITTECLTVEFRERFKGHGHNDCGGVSWEKIDPQMDRQV